MDKQKIDRLKEIILKQSFKYSDTPSFKLTSGAVSQYYFDCKQTSLDPEGAFLIGELLFDTVKDWPIVGAGGLTLGADPLGAALMHSAYRHQRNIYHFIVRKQAKGHGTARWVEGIWRAGDKVVILDDVVTTGGSVIKAIERAREDGLDIYGVIVLLDREEFSGMEKIKALVPDASVISLVTRSDIMALYNKGIELKTTFNQK